jgi:hypothetical protein
MHYRKLIFLLPLLSAWLFLGCAEANSPDPVKEVIRPDPVIKIEMNLSAFGVESDNFPSVTAYIDLVKDSSHCESSYYNPAYKGSSWSLSKEEMKTVRSLLHTDPDRLKNKYTSNKSDQPSSITTIYTAKRKYIIDDYGLQAEEPLQQLYSIVYKLK